MAILEYDSSGILPMGNHWPVKLTPGIASSRVQTGTREPRSRNSYGSHRLALQPLYSTQPEFSQVSLQDGRDILNTINRAARTLKCGSARDI